MSTGIVPIVYNLAENFDQQIQEISQQENKASICENKLVKRYKPMVIGGKTYSISKETIKKGLIDLSSGGNTLPFKVSDDVYYVINPIDQPEEKSIVEENEIDITIDLLFWKNIYKAQIN